MTDETAAPSGTPAPASAPAGATPTATPTPPPPTPATPPVPAPVPQQTDFAVPEAYKDKPWAGKVKSMDDVYKQLDNLDQLAGRKAATIDYEKATPEEITAHHAKLRPTDLTAYKYGEGADPKVTGAISEVLANAGITAYQGNQILSAVTAIAQKAKGAQDATAMSQEGYEALAKESFGDNYKEVVGGLENTIKANASDADKQLFDGMDNKTRIAIDRLVMKVSEGYQTRIANILKEHGVTESGAPGNGGTGGTPAADAAKQRSDVRKQIYELDKRPHTAQEKQVLLDKLNSLTPKG